MPKNNRVAIVGVGYSEVGRNSGLTYRQLTVQAAKAAMEDAGMEPKDIDGIGVECGSAGPELPGADLVSAQLAGTMLGIGPLNWFFTAGHPQTMSMMAVKSGACHTALNLTVLRAMMSSSEQLRPPEGATPPSGARGIGQFSAPYGSLRAPQFIAGFAMQRHMALYGTKEEHFGTQQVTQRYHASMNDNALQRTPITLEDYLNSRWVSKPCRLLDCDYPCDAGSAIIVTTEERAHDWKKKPVFVESFAMKSMNADFDELHLASPGAVGREIWSRTDLKPRDVDCAMLYDGFSVLSFMWLEAMGFCQPGESGPFVAAGNTRLGGSLPLNTDGGVCNVGRRHGASHVIESVRQLRGEGVERQVPGAEVAVYTVLRVDQPALADY